MATAAPEAAAARNVGAALAWTLLGAACFQGLPPDGSAAWVLAMAWAAAGTAMHVGAQRPEARARWSLCCDEPGSRVSALAMGWMMGTLWWHAQSCAGALGAPVWVALHAGGMVLAGTVLRRLSEGWSAAQRRAGLSVAAFGVLALLAELLWTPAQNGLAPWRGWVAMALITFAWAVEPKPARRPMPYWMWFAWGPVGLWLIHQAWLSHGPRALWWALLVWAAGVLTGAAWRTWQRSRPLQYLGETT